MAARDHQQTNVICPKCGERGVVHYSDNDYPFMKRNDRTIDSIEGNFTAGLTKDEMFQVTCKECGNTFEA